MEINMSKKYEPEAGDILSWQDGTEQILFIVVDNKESREEITGVTIRDNRDGIADNHIVTFWSVGGLNLVLKKTQLGKLAKALDTWDTEEYSGLSALFD